jgi:uncharacterized 2Fe-2S/4Fe-4S cluster protein (DUF4445 family)
VEKHSVRVTFKPDSREVWVVSGASVREALFAAAIPVSMPCGGHGRCGRCLVFAEGALSRPTAEELRRVPPGMKGARLACVARIEGEAEITIPPSSRVAIGKIAARGSRRRAYAVRPGISKVYLGGRRPERLGAALRKHGLTIGDVAPGGNTDLTLVAAGRETIGIEAGNTLREFYGLALDLGTNTVVASLVDLTTGRELGVASTTNPQVIHGDDVISRLRFAKTPGGLELLRLEMANLINGLVEEMARSLKIDRRRIYLASAVGNTAMQHIFLGVSPVDLGRAPYRARVVGPVETLASKVGLHIHPGARVMMPPVVGGFVGGDLVALVISQGLRGRKRPVMAIDLGTNGEIVLAAGGRLAACSTAAGPAFEGERISSGVRAIAGAIEDVKVTRRGIKLTSIGQGRPVGLCGSGLLAAVAELVRWGVVEPSGRLKPRQEIGDRRLAARIFEDDLGRGFVLAERPMISLRQGDIREVQLGKAAISSGIKVLCRVVGVDISQIGEVLIAGSFGSALKASSVRAVGIFPGSSKARIRVIGNSAIEGAKLLLISERARADAERIAAETEHVELFTRADFKDEFYAGIGFPSPA